MSFHCWWLNLFSFNQFRMNSTYHCVDDFKSTFFLKREILTTVDSYILQIPYLMDMHDTSGPEAQ